MRALHFDGQSVHLSGNHPSPRLKKGEALIRTVKASLSTLDRQVVAGLFEYTGVLGHEFVGIVESVEGAPNDLVGTRVVGSPATMCGQCDLCQAGLREHCRHQTMLGLHDRDGCLAELFALPIANLVGVPESVDDDRAVFASAVASALQAARQLTIEGKPFITVLGDGPMGMIAAQVMARLNASVRIIGRYSEKLEICEKWGLKHRHVDDIGRRADQDVVVECTGRSEGFALATQLVRPRGTIVLMTLRADWEQRREGVDLTPVVMNEIRVIGSRGGPINEAIGVIEREIVDVVSLISRRKSLSDGPALLQAAAQPGIMKIIVDI